MLVAYISLVIACGIVSGTPKWDHTEAERIRVLGPFANASLGIDFTCQGLGPSAEVPTSVHKLRPGDIKYVGAIGDSLTAASGGGAGTIFGMLTQYRGLSWSMGCAEDLSTTITMPNILRKCNADLYGCSVGNGNQNSANARFNVARPGAVSAEMPDQATMMVDRMIESLGIDEFQSAWKLINLFVGGNDLCSYCKDTSYYSPENYIANVKGALDIFKARMPNTLVNLVIVLNVAELQDLHEGIMCQGIQGFLCDCAIKDDETRELVRATAIQYQSQLTEFIADGKYDDKDDFTVVTQPFMEHMTVPKTEDGYADFSYFSPDCFHFSKKGHAAAAVELWNNMMEPVRAKTTAWNLEEVLKCPDSVDKYIYTSKNSP